MNRFGKNTSALGPARRAKKAFTFVELLVAVALSIVLLRGMYTIFDAAITVTRLSDEKMKVLLDASAIFDYIARDIVRSPYFSDQYYLKIKDDRKSITFQARRLDGVSTKHVYIEYCLSDSDGSYSESDHSGTNLLRKVWDNDRAAVDPDDNATATEEDDGEDGTPITIARHVQSFQVWYFAEGYDDIEDDDAWTDTPDLPDPGGQKHTRAVKFKLTLENDASEESLAEQTFTLIFPIMY